MRENTTRTTRLDARFCSFPAWSSITVWARLFSVMRPLSVRTLPRALRKKTWSGLPWKTGGMQAREPMAGRGSQADPEPIEEEPNETDPAQPEPVKPNTRAALISAMQRNRPADRPLRSKSWAEWRKSQGWEDSVVNIGLAEWAAILAGGLGLTTGNWRTLGRGRGFPRASPRNRPHKMEPRARGWPRVSGRLHGSVFSAASSPST